MLVDHYEAVMTPPLLVFLRKGCRMYIAHMGMKLTSLIALGGGIICFWGCAASERPNEFEFAPVPVTEEVSPEDKLSDAFRLGPGDEVNVRVWRHETLGRTFKIPPNGWVTFPLMGDIQLVGMTPYDLRDDLKERLLKYYMDPQVIVKITSYRSKRLYVLGAVRAPGVLYFGTPISAVEAISQSGGFTDDARESNVLLIRRKDKDIREVHSLDLKTFISKEEAGLNPFLKAGDILYVTTTMISDLAKFSRQLTSIISPVVELETAIIYSKTARDVLDGEPAQVIVTN
jgi:polysaccharide export outer membrane protein